MKITINQNDNQNIGISNRDTQDILVNDNDTQTINIGSNTPQTLGINQNENQLILIGGGGEVIGITDVLVNGVTVVSGNIAYITVPTKTSELQNNSGYITLNNIPAETDPTVPSYVKAISLADINKWNNKQDQLVSGTNIKTINNTSLLGSGNIDISGGETYTAGTGINIENGVINNTITNYNDLTDLPTIPSKTSDLINDKDFVSENNLAEVAFTGSYNSLSDTPVIPDSTSDLTNDSGFIDTTDLNTALASKQDTLVSGTNIKTINNNSILGSGDLSIGGGTSTDVQINGTSIVSNNVANIITESAYNETTNKIATKNDIPTNTSDLNNDSNFAVTNANNNFSANQSINGDLSVSGNVSQLKRATTGRWIDGRDESVINQLGVNSAGLRALASVKTQNGNWTIGNVYGGEELWFGYTTDTDYNNDNNVANVYYISPAGYTNLQLPDTGYQSLSNGVNYRKIGNIVYIDCICNGSITVGDGNYTTIATLPSSCIPPHNIMFVWNTYGGNLNNQSAFVNTLGEINLYLPAGQTSGYFGFSLSYPV